MLADVLARVVGVVLHRMLVLVLCVVAASNDMVFSLRVKQWVCRLQAGVLKHPLLNLVPSISAVVIF